MTARLVFVHGIGGPRQADVDRERWLSALITGARKAGHEDAARKLRAGTLAEVEFAYYGDLFDKPGAQGVGDLELTDNEAALLIEMLAEIVESRREFAADEHDAALLDRVLAQLEPEGDPQGLPSLLGRAINAASTLLDAGPWRTAGQWTAGKFLVRELAQVARYLEREDTALDLLIRDSVAGAFGTGPTVILAHSLGSVVSFEALHIVTGPVPLFVTMGSPLATRAIVWPHIQPRPPVTPAVVERWLNFWDRDDVIVSRRRLEKDIGPNSWGVQPVSARIDSDGAWVHTATKYLAKGDVAGPVMETLVRLASTG